MVVLYVAFALAASIQALVSGTKTFHKGGVEYNRYNNYTIFEKSSHHLKNQQDLYVLYPNEHWDLYKYTPTFSAFFGPFALLPDWLGLCTWNLLNALFLLFAVYYLPKLTNLQKGGVLLIVLIELMTSMQNAQSNGLMSGLLVLSFGLLENRKYLLAALCIVFSVYIKLFGIVGLALFLFYPQKWKLALSAFFCTILLWLVPLLFVDFTQYMKLFSSYSAMLSNDHSNSLGYSVMGWLNTWFGLVLNKNIIVLAGAAVFLIPFIRYTEYEKYTFRLWALASILIWIVIFNHKAESATFIIAITGVALWFIAAKKSTLNIALLCFAFVFTVLSPTDLFPAVVREEYVKPYTLKALPCILIWIKLIADMLDEKQLYVQKN